jgi:hypothetical protein
MPFADSSVLLCCHVWDFALISWVLGNLFHVLIGIERDLSVCFGFCLMRNTCLHVVLFSRGRSRFH